MKGPSPDAVLQAISTLFKSLNANNELELETEFPPSFNSFVNTTERYIQATQLIRHAFLRAIDDRSSYQDYNGQRPVGRLPAELLIEIFHLAAIDGRGDMSRLHNLSLVCFQWWQVIKATPRLHTNVDVTDGPIVKYQLERSGNYPLTVTIWSAQDNRLSSWALSNFMTKIEKEAHRLRKVEVEVAYDEWKVIAPCMAMPMTLLQEADLKVAEGRMIIDAPPALSLATGSNLSTLRLSNLTLGPPPADDSYGSLTRLWLDCIEMPSSTILLYHLQICPRLSVLVIKTSFANGTPRDEPELPNPIVLPHLRVLEMVQVYSAVSDHFLRSICVPNLKRLRISDHYDYSAFTIRYLSHPPFLPNDHTLLQSVLLNATFKSMKINVYTSYLDLSGVTEPDEYSTAVRADDELGLHLSLGVPDPSDVIDMLRHTHLPDVPIDLALSTSTYGASVLYSFPTAASIALSGDMVFIRECLVLLSGVDGSTGNTACPTVAEITLSPAMEREETERQALEADDGLMEDVRRLVQVRRTLEGADAVAGRNFRVSCNQESFDGERYFYDEASARFVDEEELATALDDP